jgi:hypothetical protein
MSRFLKLRNIIINVNHIRFISFQSKKYKIDFAANCFNGYWMLGSGQVNSSNYELNICEKEDPEDYKIVTEWVNNNSEL